jgi:hypothetical protein
LALAISTSPGPATATFTDRVTTSFARASIGSFNNSYISSPNGSGLIQDIAYLPFSHGAPFPYATWNVRIGLQFTEYLHLYGGSTNFDGSYLGGTHNAHGNNSVFAYAWFAF